MNLTNQKEIKELLARHGFHFSKSMGQNFLIESWVPRQTAEASGAGPGLGVLEVGPGIGPLTEQLAKLADKVAGIFVPTVIAIALLAAVIWLLAGKELSFVLRIFTAVLVIACPCALGLATPTAIMVGTGLGASNGILIRSGEALDWMLAHLPQEYVEKYGW